MEVVHEVLAYHTAEVHKQSLLLLAAERRNAFAPLLEFLDALGVCQSHEHCKQIEEHIMKIQTLAAACGLTREEVLEMFHVLMEEEE